MISFILRRSLPPFIGVLALTGLLVLLVPGLPAELFLLSILWYQLVWYVLFAAYAIGIRRGMHQITLLMGVNTPLKLVLVIAGGVLMHLGGLFEPKERILVYAAFYLFYTIFMNIAGSAFMKRFHPDARVTGSPSEDEEDHSSMES